MPDPATTDRLVVRQWRTEDAPALHEAVLESIEHLRPWMPWVANEPLALAARVEMVGGWARLWDAGDRMCGMFVDERVVGGCGLHQRIGPGGQEIGYWVRVGETGHGYATAAARAMTDMAFTMPGVTHVEIHHDVANPTSGRIPAKLGFAHVHDVARPVEAPGETGTQRIWRMDRITWRSRRGHAG
ncbi:MAG: GNAT family N-acetyltransferase [Acidimicrobiales bacterium]|nr:GNAT family N-acetyltransferase [Acidimicrobiales bacterium]